MALHFYAFQLQLYNSSYSVGSKCSRLNPLLALSTIVKKEFLGVDGAEEVLVAVGEMRRAAEILLVFVE